MLSTLSDETCIICINSSSKFEADFGTFRPNGVVRISAAPCVECQLYRMCVSVCAFGASRSPYLFIQNGFTIAFECKYHVRLDVVSARSSSSSAVARSVYNVGPPLTGLFYTYFVCVLCMCAVVCATVTSNLKYSLSVTAENIHPPGNGTSYSPATLSGFWSEKRKVRFCLINSEGVCWNLNICYSVVVLQRIYCATFLSKWLLSKYCVRAG